MAPLRGVCAAPGISPISRAQESETKGALMNEELRLTDALDPKHQITVTIRDDGLHFSDVFQIAQMAFSLADAHHLLTFLRHALPEPPAA